MTLNTIWKQRLETIIKTRLETPDPIAHWVIYAWQVHFPRAPSLKPNDVTSGPNGISACSLIGVDDGIKYMKWKADVYRTLPLCHICLQRMGNFVDEVGPDIFWQGHR